MTTPADIPDALVEKLARRRYDAGVKAGSHPTSAPGWSALVEPSKDRLRATARADLVSVWGEIQAEALTEAAQWFEAQGFDRDLVAAVALHDRAARLRSGGAA